MAVHVRFLCLIVGLILPLSTATVFAQSTFTRDFEGLLYTGKTTEASNLAAGMLDSPGIEQQARFALGTAQFLLAIEHLGQGLFRYGLKSGYDTSFTGGLIDLPFLRLPVPQNPNPEQVSYLALREVLERFVADLAVAEETLAGVTGDSFEFPLDLARITLDFDGDGKGSAQEGFLYSVGAVSGGVTSATGYLVDFDQSDAPWMRAYCHLLTAMAEFLLAHDWEAVVNQTFHNLFPDSDLPSTGLHLEVADILVEMDKFRDEYGRLPTYPYRPSGMSWDEWKTSPEYLRYKEFDNLEDSILYGNIADLIAFIHLFNWPVVEPERMASVREHLLEMVSLSRENWRRIQAETDNAREWVPSPEQTGIFRRLRVNETRVEGWNRFLDEFEAVLQGEKLIKHWRFVGKGVNVRRMFEEPRAFDPVMIAQGSAVLPYLEEGELVTSQTVREVNNLLDRGFFGYFIWFN